MGTIAITGAASGIGAATATRLTADGHRVLSVDVRATDILADLGTPAGRATAIAAIEDRSGGVLDGLVTCAGLAGLPTRPASLVVSVNYFGTVELLSGLQPLLARAGHPAAVALSSNSVTVQPGYSSELVDILLAGDESQARRAAGEGESVSTYPATKTAIARWVRRHAVQAEWAGAGIRLNAIAPGMVETPLVDEGRRDPTMGPHMDSFPIPLGHTAQPSEIAAFIAFLLGREAGFFCGSLLFIDGGTDALLRPDDWPTIWNPKTE